MLSNGSYLLESSNEKTEEPPPLFHVLVLVTLVYCIIFVTGTIGNITTIIVIARNRQLHTATNYYLVSLSVSDLTLLVSGLPAETLALWFNSEGEEVSCVLKGFVAETAANATVLTITTFTVERYMAICHPFRWQGLSKLSRALRMVVGVWVTAGVLAAPVAAQFGRTEHSPCGLKTLDMQTAFVVSSCLLFLLPMTLITVLYLLIGYRLRTTVLINSSRPHHITLHQRHVVRMLVVVVAAFFICWAPFHGQRLLALYLSSEEGADTVAKAPSLTHLYDTLLHVSGILYYFSTTVNPLLYNIMSNKFRQAFKLTFGRICGCCGGWRHHRVPTLRTSGGSTLATCVTDNLSQLQLKPNFSNRTRI